MRTTIIDQRIEAIASRQYLAFNRQQAFEAGASMRFIERRVAADDWIRTAQGVYVLRGSVGSWLRECKIAELSVPDSAIAMCAGAALQELTSFRPGRVELAVPPTTRTRSSRAVIHRFAGIETTTVKGIRVTTIAQTLFDIVPVVSGLRVERALDDCLLGGRLRLDELEERLAFYAGSRRPGLAVMDALIAERRAEGWQPPESELEVALFTVLDRLPSRPRIVRQAALPWRSPQPGRVDAFLPDHRLILEADGRRWHARVADFDRDRWRDNEAVAHGLRVQRLTWLHLHDMVADVIDLLERTFVAPAA
jgi:very-short-patch-repair endonuclease